MNDDLFDNLPDHSLDEVDKILDVLNQLATSFCDHINLARDTLDNIDTEVLSSDEKIFDYKQQIIELKDSLETCDLDIDELESSINHREYITQEELEEDDEDMDSWYDSTLFDLECEIDLLECEKVAIRENIIDFENKIDRKKKQKLKLVQTSANILYSIKIKLNDLRNYKI